MKRLKELIAESTERMEQAIREGNAVPNVKEGVRLLIDDYIESEDREKCRRIAVSNDEVYTAIDCLLAEPDIMDNTEMCNIVRSSYRALVA